MVSELALMVSARGLTTQSKKMTLVISVCVVFFWQMERN